MEKDCASCGRSFSTKRESAKTCSDRCRQALRRNGPRSEPEPAAPLSTEVADRLGRELVSLGVAETYEGVVALGIARQLDNGSVAGTAYVSLSKELDRRVAELRRRAPRADDQTQSARAGLAAKRAELRAV